ncbi:MAG: hypothetical protein JSV92_04135 [archaeon]|nr:MAG: hypothetical protein JSV92_04135 [archaeon]
MKKGLIPKTLMLLAIFVIALVILIVIIQTSVKPQGESLSCQARLKEGCIEFITDGGCRLESTLRPVSDGYVDSETAKCSMGTDDEDSVLEHCCKAYLGRKDKPTPSVTSTTAGSTSSTTTSTTTSSTTSSSTTTSTTATTTTTTVTIPDYFDWRDYKGENWMTGVKDQGACGSSWAFATLGSMEAKYNIQEDDPDLDIDLSEQYLVSDCHPDGDCSGGIIYDAFVFANNTGVATESCYNYIGIDSFCPGSNGAPCPDGGDLIELWEMNNFYGTVNTGYLRHDLIHIGPPVIAVCTPFSNSGRKDKDGCVIYDCCSDTPNHALVLVGYNNSGDYWISKNSWGFTPGDPCDDGYLNLDPTSCYISSYIHPLGVLPP